MGGSPNPASDCPGCACQRCEPGKYQDEIGASTCKACMSCPNGIPRHSCSFGSEGVCPSCAPGRYIKAMACRDCGAGWYSAESDSANCTKCEEGKYQLQAGKTYCESKVPCNPGERVANASSFGLARCEQCGAGWYSAESGSANCTECEEGKYQLQEGKTHCESCPANSEY